MESCGLLGEKKVIEELERGREMTQKLKALLVTNSSLKEEAGSVVSVDELLTHVCGSFSNAISILCGKRSNGGVSDSDEVNFPAAASPRKSDDSGDSSKCTPPVIKDRRGCYKRRKAAHSFTVETDNLVDDGHAWRKYGQKIIFNTKHPRSYFRCTHKYDQNCQATKQVQRLDQEPTLYRIIYYGEHTCKNPFKASQLILEDPSYNIDSSKLLCFSTTNNSPTKMDHPTPSTKPSDQCPKENVLSLPHQSSPSSSSGLDHDDYELFPSSANEAYNHHLNDDLVQGILSGISYSFHMDYMIGRVQFSDDAVLEFGY